MNYVMIVWSVMVIGKKIKLFISGRRHFALDIGWSSTGYKHPGSHAGYKEISVPPSLPTEYL